MRNQKPIALLALTYFFLSCTAIMAAEDAKKQGAKKKAEQAKSAQQEKRNAAQNFIRLKRDKNKELVSLDTSIVRYTATKGKYKGVVVDLIGAVHIGEKSYYQKLNKEFEQYESMLYELVAPRGTKIPKGGRNAGSGPISFLQKGMKNLLNLEFQLEQVDYTKKNFVHADMSPTEFAKSMKDRNESFLKMFFKMMGQSMAQHNRGGNSSSDAELLFALFSKNRDVKLKRIMAEQLSDVNGPLQMLDDKDGSTILTERNKVALKVLQEQLKKGKKKIAIFYGAAHLPDMHKRLVEEFGLKKTKVRWVEAWNLRDSGQKKSDKKPKKKPATKKKAA